MERSRAIFTRRTAPLAAIAMAALGCAAGSGELDEAPPQLEEETISEAAQAVVSDPSSVVTTGYCVSTYTWNGTTARVYWPANGGCSATFDSPLVVLLHGATYAYTDYPLLLRHLARNGFIAATVDVLAADDFPQDHVDAAEEAWTFVEDFLLSNWSLRDNIDQSSIALVGHSRGGATVRFLADKLSTERPNAVKSVVSLAPTGDDNELMTGVDTEGFLTLHDSLDHDVNARNVYKHHDRSGDDGPQFDPVWDNDVLYRSMKLLEGGSHEGFSNRTHPAGTVIPQHLVTQGYVLAFLKKHNAGDATWYEDYIRGDAVPGSWGWSIISQYSDGWARRVIDHFEDGALSNSTIGDAVSTNGTVTASVIDLSVAPAVYVHKTRALHVAPDSEGSSVQWAIPSGKRNALALEWLSFRIGQVSGAAADDVFVQIRNGSTWSAEVAVSAHGTIAQPIGFCVQVFGGCNGTEMLRTMGTVRVPLSALGDHDDVTAVRVKFRGDTLSASYVLDNLEFSESVLQP